MCSGVYFVTIVGGGIEAKMLGLGEFVFAPSVNAQTMLSVLPVMMFGFGPTDVLASLRREMEHPMEMPKSILQSHMVAFFIYYCAGAVGYWGFGTSVQAIISQSMCDAPGCPGVDGLTSAEAGSKWMFGYMLAFAIVVNLFMIMPLVLFCLFKGIEASYPEEQPMDPNLNIAMRIGTCLFSVTLGLVVPYFLQVVSIISSVLLVPLVFFFPLSFSWKAARDIGRPHSVVKCVFNIAVCFVGIGCLVMGLTDALESLWAEMAKAV